MNNLEVKTKVQTPYEKYCKWKPCSASLKKAKAKYYRKMKQIKLDRKAEELENNAMQNEDALEIAKRNYWKAVKELEIEMSKDRPDCEPFIYF